MDPVILTIVITITAVLAGSVAYSYLSGAGHNGTLHLPIKDPEIRRAIKRSGQAIAALERYIETAPDDSKAQTMLNDLKQKHERDFSKYIRPKNS